MNAREANVLLTRAALLDPRMKRVDAGEQADMASAWADALADVPLEAALAAVTAHYRSVSTALMPADVLALAGVEVDPWGALVDVTAEVVEASKVRQLAAAGVTVDELEANEHDVVWLRAKFGHLAELERTPFGEVGESE